MFLSYNPLFNPIFWLFALPGLLLGMFARSRLNKAFNRYSNVRTLRNVTGVQVARQLLDAQGLYDVDIEENKQGALSNYYDPRIKVLRLSSEVYYTPSIAAAGVAAHEMGHALQDAASYGPLRFRSTLVPAAQFSTNLAPIIFLAGMLLQGFGAGSLGYGVAWLAIILFAVSTFAFLVTLPVEFDASKRAKRLLLSHGILVGDEIEGVNKVLDAAAWTYVAAAVSAIGQLLYYVFILTGRRRR